MYRYVKRGLDALFAGLAVVILTPFMIPVVIALKLTGEGEVFYRQNRVGQHRRLFGIWKFATMLKDSPNMGTGSLTVRRDPRVTPVGRFLRQYSLDELPQLLSIVRGDMSIVGPRPPLLSEVRRYEKHQLRRLSVPQGLTCIWQISGRSDVSFEDWVNMDLAYIDSWSLRQDIKIILKTFRVVIKGQGAY